MQVNEQQESPKTFKGHLAKKKQMMSQSDASDAMQEMDILSDENIKFKI